MGQWTIRGPSRKLSTRTANDTYPVHLADFGIRRSFRPRVVHPTAVDQRGPPALVLPKCRAQAALFKDFGLNVVFKSSSFIQPCLHNNPFHRSTACL